MLLNRVTKTTFILCESHLLKQTSCLPRPKRFIHITSKLNTNRNNINMEGTFVNKVPDKSPGEIESLTRLTIGKSQQDNRDYRGLRLSNGMKVVLVSDPQTDVAAAALAVEVGHMSDPDYVPGLAHFCEHMLFLGTEKYPNENDYAMYLSNNSGGSNAATYPYMTKYYFHVASDSLNGALDRFAQFFISPLFTPSATDREINAVNSEHEKNVSRDSWRIKSINKHLAKKDHPFSKFGGGNKYTLVDMPKERNIDVRDELLKFHAKWYSANIMNLAVIGKESLDDLEKMVIEKFAQIKNKNVELPVWPEEPFAPDQFKRKVLIMPIQDIRSMTVTFPTKDLSPYYNSSPNGYLTHLLGHETKGSILYELRLRGWCNNLLAGHSNTSRGFGFFDIIVDLTQEGTQHMDEIVLLIFQYLRMLREEGPQKWIFDECRNIGQTHFRFKDKDLPESLVIGLADSMQLYPLEEVLTAPYLVNEWRPDLITNLLNDLVPEKSRIIIVNQNLEKQLTRTEPWYGTKFDTAEVDAETINKWSKCERHKNLTLPAPNAFIPTDFNLAPVDNDVSKNPVILNDTPIMRVWHKQDNTYLTPKVCMSFDFSNPMVYSDPLNCSLNHMLVNLVRDQLSDYVYDAELTGLRLHVINTSSGITVIIKGYHDKQDVLLRKVLDHLFNFKCNADRFEIKKEEYLRVLKNFKTDQPYKHAIYYLTLILTENTWSKGELIDAFPLLTKERLEAFAKEFFSRLHAECFIYGNANKERALELANIVNKRLEATNSIVLPLLEKQMLTKREYKLNDGDSYLFENTNDFHKTSCAELYFQCEAQSERSIALVDLASQIISEPCYDVLRTKEQLGYIVLCEPRKFSGATGLRILVQSTKHPSFVEFRIENFLDDMMNKIEQMSDEDFRTHKEGLINKKLEKAKSFSQQFDIFSVEIALAHYYFERAEAEVAILRQTTKEDFLNYMKTYISRDAPKRRIFSVHIVSSQMDQANFEAEQPFERPAHIKVTDLSAFKLSKELFPLWRPALNIRAKGARSKL